MLTVHYKLNILNVYEQIEQSDEPGDPGGVHSNTDGTLGHYLKQKELFKSASIICCREWN